MHNLRFKRPRSVPCPLNNETKKKTYIDFSPFNFFLNYNLKSIF